MGKKISVIGDGGWGTALSILLAQKGHRVTLWSAFEDYARFLDEHRENVKFLPKVRLPAQIKITADIKEAVAPAEIVVFAVPSQFARQVLGRIKVFDFSKKILVIVTKGIESVTLKRPSEVIFEVLGKVPLVVMSGPTHAEEVARNIPSSIVASSRDLKLARRVQKEFMTDQFRVYTSPDVVGVELGGALKNVIAIAAGIADGLKLGDNTKAALMTRGLAEMARLGKAMGGRPETFAGLSGMGDLITTCISVHSRNRRLGEMIASGVELKQALSATEMVTEGYKTAQSAYELARRRRVEMPIVEGVYQVLYHGMKPEKILIDLMKRKAKSEFNEKN